MASKLFAEKKMPQAR